MKSFKAQVINDEWLRVLSGTQDATINKTNSAYAKIPLIYRAVRMRCDSLARVPIHVYEGEKELEDWPYTQSLKSIIWHTEASHLLRGGAVWVKLRNRYNLDKGIQVLNPFTVEITYDYNLGERKFDQYLPTGQHYAWSESQVVFWREYNPLDDIAWGTAAAEVALGDSQIMHYLSRFQREFFKSGAMPTTLVGLEDANTTEVDRMQTWFEKTMSGVSRAWRILGVRGKISPVNLTPSFKDMALPEVRTQAFSAIVQAFGIPETVFNGQAANFATAGVEKQTYITDTIGPRAQYYQDGLNDFLEPTGVRLEFGVEELSEMQEDEQQRAQAYASYVNAQMPPEVARQILGIDIPADAQAYWDSYLARKEEQANTPPPQTSPNVGQGQANNEQSGNGLNDALRLWQKKATKRFREGKSANVDFVDSRISSELVERIKLKLAEVKVKEDIVQAFPKDVEEPDIRTEISHLKDLILIGGKKESDMKFSVNLDGGDIGQVLGDELGKKLGDAMKELKFEQQPVIVNIPEQKAPIVNVTVPQQAAPVINIPPAQVLVNVPEQKPPDIKVDVNMPEPKPRKIIRDASGRMKEIE